MLKCRKVAVTGNVACGKSTVCRLLKELGAEWFSADEAVHQLLAQDPAIIHQVVEWLGKEVWQEGHLDRSLMARIVFNNPSLLRGLERILHPAVRSLMEQAYQQSTQPLFVAEIPLLFEGGEDASFDATVFVDTPEEVCRKRFHKGPEEFDRRQSRLLPASIKREKATYILNNHGSLDELKQEVLHLYLTLQGADAR